MSSSSTRVTDRHFAYLAERTKQEDPFLVELKAAAREAGIPEIWVSPEQASLMEILIKAVGAREVVEVGALAGYAAIRMARSLPEGGRVRTVELSEKHADFAESWAQRSDVASKVEVHRGKGTDVLEGFEADSADAIFIDADKEGYSAYLREGLRIVRSGGLFLVDNAFAFGQLFDDSPSDSGAEVIRRFNEEMARIPNLQSVIVPIGDGLWVGVKS